MLFYTSIFLLAGLLAFVFILKSRNMHIWIVSYIKQKISRKTLSNFSDKHIYFCLADHYEPYFGAASQSDARKLVEDWDEKYRNVVKGHSDSNGRSPVHSYFYPEEEYDEWILNKIQKLCEDKLGDVDIHLHHDNDTAENLEKTLNRFKSLLYEKHGLLRKNNAGEIVYGFIHGNWALDNSRPDRRWCGIDNELDVLINTGCDYDMTMPSAPSDTQTTTINTIYLAKEDGKCKSHNKGKELKVGDWKQANELLMIQGPLTLNWKSRKLGLIPRIESGELSADAPPTKQRVELWESCSVSVKGAEDHVFIKLHTHGLQKSNMQMFFDNGGFETLWTSLEDKYKNTDGYQLHYVSAWDMYEKIKSLALKETE